MQFKQKIVKKVEIKYLKVEADVRYYDDGKINGEMDDADNPKVPCYIKGLWAPLINLNTGIIENWQKGVVAKIHYKVADAGVYSLIDENNIEVIKLDGYVPNMLSPKEDGYGDYIIMDIDENGKIEDFKADLTYFETQE